MENTTQMLLLIGQCRNGSSKAFTQLVSEYQELVFRLAFRLLGDESEARDMVQETFVKVWMAIDSYRVEHRFSTWIYKIASNTCYDRLRALQRSPSFHSSETIVANLQLDTGEDIEQAFSNKELGDWILRFTEELTPKQKLVFTLRDLEDLDVEEVMTITGMSAEKIKSNLYQARQQIRMKITQIYPDL